MRLVFVRHGESVANAEERLAGHNDSELTDLGRTQARALHDRLNVEGLRPTHLYSSPLKRAAETARIASGSWPLPIVPWDDLMETDIGVFEGLSWDEIKTRYPDLGPQVEKSRMYDAVPGAERASEKRARGRRIVEEVLARHSNADAIVLFTHGGILQWIFAALMDSERAWSLGARNTALFDFVIDLEQWRNGDGHDNTSLWRIERFNDSDHLRV